MRGVLKNLGAWLLVFVFAYAAIVVPWDQFGGGRIRKRIVQWIGWRDMKLWGATVLRRVAYRLETSARTPPDRPSGTEKSAQGKSEPARRRILNRRQIDVNDATRIPRPAEQRRRRRRTAAGRLFSDTEGAADPTPRQRRSLGFR